MRANEIREGDVIYTDTDAYIVEDTDDFPLILARSERTDRLKSFNTDELWSPETGIFHPLTVR